MADLSSGERFGAYAIIAVAGSGGMGIIYQASQRSLGRTVALKLIRSDVADSGDYRARFLREACRCRGQGSACPVRDLGSLRRQSGRARSPLRRKRRLVPRRSSSCGGWRQASLDLLDEPGRRSAAHRARCQTRALPRFHQ